MYFMGAPPFLKYNYILTISQKVLSLMNKSVAIGFELSSNGHHACEEMLDGPQSGVSNRDPIYLLPHTLQE